MTRAERRHRRRRAIARRHYIIRTFWWSARELTYGRRPEDNLAWRKCAKWNFAHGCPLCHFDKYDRKSRRKRRRALDAEIEFSIESWCDGADQSITRSPDHPMK